MDDGGLGSRNRTLRPDWVVRTCKVGADQNCECLPPVAGAVGVGVGVGTERSGLIQKEDPGRCGLSRLRWPHPCPFRKEVLQEISEVGDAYTVAAVGAVGAAVGAAVAGADDGPTAFLPSNRDY